jgi:hypothetical protein
MVRARASRSQPSSPAKPTCKHRISDRPFNDEMANLNLYIIYLYSTVIQNKMLKNSELVMGVPEFRRPCSPGGMGTSRRILGLT